jgi:hypothetical protein
MPLSRYFLTSAGMLVVLPLVRLCVVDRFRAVAFFRVVRFAVTRLRVARPAVEPAFLPGRSLRTP